MDLETEAATAPTPSEISQLASFVGRLYLLLVTVVYDHSRWLPKALRDDYKAALAEVYPSVWELQTALRNLEASGHDSAARRRQRLRAVGLTGAQLRLKLAAYDRAEARFYGVRVGSEFRPDREFTGVEEVWLLPSLAENVTLVDVEVVTEGAKEPRSRALAEQAGPPANTILFTLLSVFQVAESYKEIKEAVEWGLKNGKLVVRIGNGAWRVVNAVISRRPKLRRRRPQREREPA